METIRDSMVDCGLANFVLPGQHESGDHYLVASSQDRVLIAAIDGLGHGEDAANAAKTAKSVLQKRADEPIDSLVQHCHERLRRTRGVVLSLAAINPSRGVMTWLGVGNVRAVLMRAHAGGGAHETLLLRGGVVGSQLPPLRVSVLPISQGDTVYLATDGVRSEFAETLTARENPQRAADRILGHFHNGTDDALVLVTRLTGIGL
jgi:phosphoserine phosphatase RsbX